MIHSTCSYATWNGKTVEHLAAYNQLVAALDDRDPAIRELAQHLIHRRSPSPDVQRNGYRIELAHELNRH